MFYENSKQFDERIYIKLNIHLRSFIVNFLNVNFLLMILASMMMKLSTRIEQKNFQASE